MLPERGRYDDNAVFRNATVSYVDKSNDIVFVVLISGAENVRAFLLFLN